MQVLFTSRHPQAKNLRDLTEHRVRFAFRRLKWLLPRAEVQMSDVNGPRGGVDKRCQVTLRTEGAGSVVVTSISNDWRTSLDDALARASRYALRQWRRGKSPRRLQHGILTQDG